MIMASLSVIYKITNLLNGKIYIGKELKYNIQYYGSGILIRKAIIKYGQENFRKDIIEECQVDQLNEREKYWIEFLNSRAPVGYNKRW
jgi:hypothetical protein